MLTIYGRTTSSSTQLVKWTADELKIEYEWQDYGHGFAATNTAEYLAKNPMGKVPVVEDQELILFESAAILRYLSAKYGDNKFWPNNLAERASLDKWAEWGKNSFTEAVLEIFVYDVRLSPHERDPQILKLATEKLVPLAKVLDRQLQNKTWIGGSQFTFADIACGHILYRYFNLEWDRPNCTNLDSYYERLQEREHFRECVMVSYEPLRGSY